MKDMKQSWRFDSWLFMDVISDRKMSEGRVGVEVLEGRSEL